MQPATEQATPPPQEKKPSSKQNREALERVIQQKSDPGNQDRIYGSLNNTARRGAEGANGSDIYQELLKRELGEHNPALQNGGSIKLSRELIKRLDSLSADRTAASFPTDAVVREFISQKRKSTPHIFEHQKPTVNQPEETAQEDALEETPPAEQKKAFRDKVRAAFDSAQQKAYETITPIEPLKDLTVEPAQDQTAITQQEDTTDSTEGSSSPDFSTSDVDEAVQAVKDLPADTAERALLVALQVGRLTEEEYEAARQRLASPTSQPAPETKAQEAPDANQQARARATTMRASILDAARNMTEEEMDNYFFDLASETNDDEDREAIWDLQDRALKERADQFKNEERITQQTIRAHTIARQIQELPQDQWDEELARRAKNTHDPEFPELMGQVRERLAEAKAEEQKRRQEAAAQPYAYLNETPAQTTETIVNEELRRPPGLRRILLEELEEYGVSPDIIAEVRRQLEEKAKQKASGAQPAPAEPAPSVKEELPMQEASSAQAPETSQAQSEPPLAEPKEPPLPEAWTPPPRNRNPLTKFAHSVRNRFRQNPNSPNTSFLNTQEPEETTPSPILSGESQQVEAPVASPVAAPPQEETQQPATTFTETTGTQETPIEDNSEERIGENEQARTETIKASILDKLRHMKPDEMDEYLSGLKHGAAGDPVERQFVKDLENRAHEELDARLLKEIIAMPFPTGKPKSTEAVPAPTLSKNTESPGKIEPPPISREAEINKIIQDSASFTPEQLEYYLQNLVGVGQIDTQTAQEIRERLNSRLSS